ncbi:TadE/TadG family type IV pilus assembly protein [Devosia sp. SD17-2]|jgi:Flp pilus assembly protein TadG|uniref:TadE/TadG family type IV pilus assembly protein n=1 Tax=Devosia sp. SD17-2 TaxID=2976459 RepID=UPI0023D891F2|nr:TadE/TadG family type IV pilus assembly protein [Devosia sp. SD17-2]WEJ33344.1 pilus assembly protein [Devosia sp. SD17-2]
MSLLSALARNERASSAVEFAILTPAFFLLLTGMMAYGIYFGAAISLQQLAADSARIAIAGLSEAERNRLVDAYIDRHARGYPLIDRARLRATIGDHPDDPSQYSVQLRYDASLLPIWNLYPPLPLPSQQMTAGATIRQGGL